MEAGSLYDGAARTIHTLNGDVSVIGRMKKVAESGVTQGLLAF